MATLDNDDKKWLKDNFITKVDAKNFLTKDDSKNFATKKDIKRLEKKLDYSINYFDKYHIVKLENRVANIENKLHFPVSDF